MCVGVFVCVCVCVRERGRGTSTTTESVSVKRNKKASSQNTVRDIVYATMKINNLIRK